MSSKMSSGDHVIVVSLLVGVIFLLILERGKGGLPGRSGPERAAGPTSDPMRSPPDSGYQEDREAQKRTTEDIYRLGHAMFSWLTDQVSAEAAGQSQSDKKMVDLDDYHLISHKELTKILVPQYIQAVPEKDGWGHPYEFHLHVMNPVASRVMCIRSPGRDGRFSTRNYEVGGFPLNKFDEDIVWADGYFVRWPTNE
ncbi:MAG TPA: hypothetical protein VGP73_27230 [Thermoanaerobaculia bacterium]